MLPSKNPKTIALLKESLQISIAKKSIYDACLKFLKKQSLPVRSEFLVEKINEIPIKTFECILVAKDSEELYDKRMMRIVKLIIRQYRI